MKIRTGGSDKTVKNLLTAICLALLVALVGMTIVFAQLAMAEDEADVATNRIDFGNSYVQGQSIKSGAVYLMNRKKNEISSMLKRREHYRDEILAEYPEYREEPEDEDAQAPEESTAKIAQQSGARLKTH